MKEVLFGALIGILMFFFILLLAPVFGFVMLYLMETVLSPWYGFWQGMLP